MITAPILVLIAAYFILGEGIGMRKVIGILIGIAGAGYLIVNSQQSTQSGNSIWLGDLYVFLNASSYGIYLVLVKKMMRLYHPMVVIKWVYTFGLLFVLPFGLLEVSESNFRLFTPDIWLSFVYVLIFTSFLAYLFNAYALKSLSPTIVGTYVYLQPILTTMLAVMTGKDKLTWPLVVTALLICLGIYLVSVGSKDRGEPK
jgi:drug/metabolite transporter (DMT)-like permease